MENGEAEERGVEGGGGEGEEADEVVKEGYK